MGYQNLECHDADGVRRITINRPDKLNALNRATITELAVAFAQARDEDAVRVVVLAGAGDKAFVAGADISELEKLDPQQALAFSEAGQRLMRSVERLGKPVIARIQGFALGGGMELAMACHLRIASDRAQFGQPEIKLGLVPGFGGTQRLRRLVGSGAALALCLEGGNITAQRALELGVVTQLVAANELDARVDALASQLAGFSQPAMRAVLETVLEGGECSIDQGLAFESQSFALLFAGADMREGTRAFLERRKPVFGSGE